MSKIEEDLNESKVSESFVMCQDEMNLLSSSQIIQQELGANFGEFIEIYER